MTKEFTVPVPVLHGASVECDVGTEWDAVDECSNAKDNTSH